MSQGVVRIIGGKWRGRKLPIPMTASAQGLRPTPDRVRETLFNWLSPYLPGARCLDMFAGSGALGFEALSRGAAFVEMVEASPAVVAHLKAQAQRLAVENLDVYQALAPQGLRSPSQPFEVVFLDPPYQSDYLLPACYYLEEHFFLSKTAMIYLEAQRKIQENELPANWRLLKSQQAGQVFYHLAYRALKEEKE